MDSMLAFGGILLSPFGIIGIAFVFLTPQSFPLLNSKNKRIGTGSIAKKDTDKIKHFLL